LFFVNLFRYTCHMLWLSQAFSIGAIVLFFISFQIKNKNLLLVFNSAGNFLYGLSFIYFGAWFGFATAMCATLRGFLFVNIEKRPKLYRYFALVLILSILTFSEFYSFEGFTSLLVYFGCCLFVCSLWAGKTILIRFGALASSIPLAFYNLFAHTYINVILEAMIILSSLVFFARILITRHHHPKSSFPRPEVAMCK